MSFFIANIYFPLQGSACSFAEEIHFVSKQLTMQISINIKICNAYLNIDLSE